MRGPEAAIKDQIRKWLKEQGAYVFSPVQMGFGAQTLDLLVCWNGHFVALEVKAPKKKTTKRQDLIMTEIEKAGGDCYVVTDVAQMDQMRDWFK